MKILIIAVSHGVNVIDAVRVVDCIDVVDDAAVVWVVEGSRSPIQIKYDIRIT